MSLHFLNYPRTAFLLAKFRPRCPIIAITRDARTARIVSPCSPYRHEVPHNCNCVEMSPNWCQCMYVSCGYHKQVYVCWRKLVTVSWFHPKLQNVEHTRLAVSNTALCSTNGGLMCSQNVLLLWLALLLGVHLVIISIQRLYAARSNCIHFPSECYVTFTMNTITVNVLLIIAVLNLGLFSFCGTYHIASAKTWAQSVRLTDKLQAKIGK